MKYSAAGAVVWGFTPSGAGESQATGVALDAAGNIYITGWFKNSIDLHGLSALGAGILISSGGEDWFVASYTPAGLLRWCTKLGGTSDERPVGVAVSSSGVYAFGTVKTNITTAFGSIPASLPNGKLNLVLAKYSLLGVGQSLISGGSGQDELANSVVADDDGVYVASRTKDNDLLWYGPTGLIVASASAAVEWDLRVTAFTTSGTHAWTATVSELSDAIEQAPSKLALGCGALYLTGLTHGPATFAGVGSVSSTTHDFFYLGRIERATGQFVWVNKGTSTGPHHTTGGTDLAVGQNGLVHVVGKFKDNLTMGTRSITSTNGKVQPFMASFRPTGSGASLEDLISSNDATANAITADDQGNFILAGSYKANLACAALSLTGPNDLNGFLVKGSIPALAGVDISFWSAPATMCSNAAPLDLSTLVTPYQTGNAASVVTSSNVFSPPSILGGVLGNYAQFNTANGYVTVDLGVTVPVGGIISLLWNANGSGATATTLVGTANPPTIAQSAFTTSSTTDVYTSIVLTTPTRYLRITRSATSPSFDVDGVYYEYGNDLGGTWSGTGVSGSTFDPTGLSGPVSITYTVGTPPCTTASSNSINVEAAPVGGSITSSANSMICPGNNSGTLTLSGYTGTVTGWLMSTDGFATSTAIANTTATLPFSNLLVTTQYRARVGVTGCGGALSGIQTVQVGDNTAPVITTCPPAQTIYVGATCQVALPNLLPGAAGTDNCSTSLTWSQFPAAGALVNRGIHVVTITATDASGNSTTCNVTITAADNTAPVITGCPSNISMNADPGECSAIYNFAPPTATDNCGIVLSAINVIAIADVDGNVVPALLAPNEYPVGVTTRTFTFSDASGNISTCSFTITVVDTQFPTVVSCPGDITVPADAGACGANVTYALPTFNDNCLFRVDRTQGLASGAFFPVGTTQVEYTATDSSNHSVNCVFNVIVQDLQNPVITGCPSNISVQAPLAGTGANATWTAPTATDNCGAATVAQTAGQAPGSFFLIGTHTITYTATGPNGGTSTCTFTVTVISNGAPTITCPANQTLYSTQANCAQVFNYATPPVSDDLPLPAGQPVQIDGSGYSSGSAFSKGTTVQTWRVTDSNANSTTCTFNVQVIDTIRPTLQPCPTNITLNADAGACGAIYTYTPPSATDNCDGALTVIRIAGPASGSLFPIGTTIVRHRATDLSGRFRNCEFTVTVVDNIFPTLSNCPADMLVSAATNACGAYVTFTSPTASDNCSAALTQTLGPVSGSLFPIGDTPVEFTATDPAGQFHHLRLQCACGRHDPADVHLLPRYHFSHLHGRSLRSGRNLCRSCCCRQLFVPDDAAGRTVERRLLPCRAYFRNVHRNGRHQRTGCLHLRGGGDR
ncbi:MAG: HYR domain-containing protein [Flavobacteriales bacterium]|nr:HYR domain-containing protein [Flavobacteriales bacterium]